MKIKLKKQDVKAPDQMTKTLREGFVWTTSHSKIVIGGIAVFILLGAGFSIYGYMSSQKEDQLQAKYFTIEKSYTEKKQGFDESARNELMAAQNKNKKDIPAVDAAKKASGDIEKDYGMEIASFKALIDEGRGTVAADMSALNLSEIYSSYKMLDEALASLALVEKDLPANRITTALVLQRMGSLLADNNDCKGALEKWQKVVDNKTFSFAHDEVKLRMGLCYEMLQNWAKAEELYKEVSDSQGTQNSDFVASRDAQKYLMLLKVKKNAAPSSGI